MPDVTSEADRHKFPGLLAHEVVILRAWLRLHQSEYDRFDYNVRLGEGDDPGPTFTPEVRRNAVLNTQLRVDAVGYRGGDVTLIEVKDQAGPNAIGQLLTYFALWVKGNPLGTRPKLLLVTNRLTEDMRTALQQANIPYSIAIPQ